MQTAKKTPTEYQAMHKFSSFFLKFCSSLHDASVNYGVMRNWDLLPDKHGNSDIDIVFDHGSKSVVMRLLKDAAHSNNGSIIASDDCGAFVKVSVIGYDKVGGNWWSVCLDFNFGLTYRGIPYFSGRIADVVQYQSGFYRVKDGWSETFGYLKELLNNNSHFNKFFNDTSVFLKSFEKNDLHSFMITFNASGLLFNDFIEKGKFNENRKISWRFRLSMFTSSPFLSLIGTFMYFQYRLKRVVYRCGKVVAFYGADGVGKSTIISKVSEALTIANHGNTISCHLRPKLLPALSSFSASKQSWPSKIQTSHVFSQIPHSKPPSGFIFSLARLSYHLLDYTVGFFIKCSPLLRKNCSYILFDRYVYDLVIDPLRFRINLPTTLIRFLVRFVPTADINIFLVADPEIVRTRKQELSLEEIKRQQREIFNLSRSINNFIIINTSLDSLDRSTSICLQKISSTSSDRQLYEI